MIKAVVKFWGTTQDEYGMPVPYHSYLVVASPWYSANDGIASVLPLSTATPLKKSHYPVLNGGVRAAFNEAITALKSESENKELNFHMHEYELSSSEGNV